MLGLDNPLHIAIVLIVVLMVFGAKRLPEMGKSMGEGLRGFKESISGETPLAHLDATSAPTASAVTPSDAQPVSAGPEATQPRAA
jgi:sec-independent protein translocase protein TatA